MDKKTEAAAVTAANPRPHVLLGGRRFLVIDFEQRTVLQDHYLQRMIRALELDKALPGEGETDTAYLVRMHSLLVDSGRAHELLAGYLLPEGMDERAWTPAGAAEVAAHIGGCNAEQDRELVLALGMQAVFGYFKAGLELLARFRAFSAASSPEAQMPPNAPVH